MSDADKTASMPSQSPDASIGDALFAAVSGKETPSTELAEPWVPEGTPKHVTDLDKLALDADDNTTDVDPGQAEKAPAAPAEPEDVIEFKVKGFKEPVKLPKNWEDPKVQEYINKGIRFDKRIQEVARQSKELEAKLARMSDYETKAELAGKVDAARALMEEGHAEHALRALMGESTQEFLEHLVEERIKYREASPEERIKMDLERERREKQLKAKQDADRIAALEAQINARSEQVREAEYSGYIEDARSRYDLSQWVDDADVASDWNDMIHSAAMQAVVKLQKQREAQGKENISQRDIRREYAKRVKRVLAHLDSQSSKVADTKVTQQKQVAKANAQVASTKNYGQPDVGAEWQKSGGSMSDLVDMLTSAGRRIF